MSYLPLAKGLLSLSLPAFCFPSCLSLFIADSCPSWWVFPLMSRQTCLALFTNFTQASHRVSCFILSILHNFCLIFLGCHWLLWLSKNWSWDKAQYIAFCKAPWKSVDYIHLREQISAIHADKENWIIWAAFPSRLALVFLFLVPLFLCFDACHFIQVLCPIALPLWFHVAAAILPSQEKSLGPKREQKCPVQSVSCETHGDQWWWCNNFSGDRVSGEWHERTSLKS